MVEEVEGFGAELEAGALIDCEALKETEVKVQASGQRKSVAADVSESESRGGLEGIGVIKEGSTLTWILVGGEPSLRTACQIRMRGSRSDAIADAGVIAEVSQTVGHGEGEAALRDGNTGHLPATQNGVSQAGGPEKWQRVNIADR